MGLLDFLSSQGGGGLLSGLYPSPLLNPAVSEQPVYDIMGNSTGYTSGGPVDPFPLAPGRAAAFQPPPGVFGAPPQFGAGPTMGSIGAVPGAQGPMAGMFAPQSAPMAPPPQAAPARQPQPGPPQVNDINVGGYQMPRMGSAADFTPQGDVTTPPNAQPAQGQLPQGYEQPQQLPPAFGGGRSVLGRIGNPDGLIARLTGNDSRSIAQQNLKAQYDSLVPLVGPQKAMLAVMNPEAGKIILAQALEKKNYGFTKTDNDQIVATDPQTGKATLAYGSPAASSIQGPDGKLIEMPAGADPKTWRNEITRINADVAAGKKTEVQAKAEIFANKMELSNKSITDGVGTSLAGKIASGIPLGNYVQSPEYQKYKQASSNFITALLRQESGAAISKTEFDRYDKEYMPQPGDGAEVLAQKAEARRVAIEGMKKGAGPGYKAPTPAALPSGWSVSVR